MNTTHLKTNLLISYFLKFSKSFEIPFFLPILSLVLLLVLAPNTQEFIILFLFNLFGDANIIELTFSLSSGLLI